MCTLMLMKIPSSHECLKPWKSMVVVVVVVVVGGGMHFIKFI